MREFHCIIFPGGKFFIDKNAIEFIADDPENGAVIGLKSGKEFAFKNDTAEETFNKIFEEIQPPEKKG